MEILGIFILGAAGGAGVMWLAGRHKHDVLTHFENIANKVLEDRAHKADAALKTQLEPFTRNMELLSSTIQTARTESFALKEQVEKISSQANNLANALTHRPESRGNWGEVMLEKMLEDSGLRKDRDYQTQATRKNTDGESDTASGRPDVILNLPEGKHLIIDSKLTLNSYTDYIANHEEIHWKKFVVGTRKHINDLSGKHYPQAQGVESPDFTLMFMPIEGAFVSLMQKAPELQREAWDKKIVLTSPSILFAMLQTVASLWRLDSQNKNADEIARLGGALYDKIAGFDEDMKKLGGQLNKAALDFETTHKKLSSGSGNILSRTQTLRTLGAKTKKALTEVEPEE